LSRQRREKKDYKKMTKKGFIYYISDYYNGDLGKILVFVENTTFAN
jgi:hypothetical protein